MIPDSINKFSIKAGLLERNLFVILMSNTVHPIEYTIKSGTISAINFAIKNNKEIYRPKELVGKTAQLKYQSDIKFY